MTGVICYSQLCVSVNFTHPTLLCVNTINQYWLNLSSWMFLHNKDWLIFGKLQQKEMFCSFQTFVTENRNPVARVLKKKSERKTRLDVLNCIPCSQDKFSTSRSPRLPSLHFESRPLCTRKPLMELLQEKSRLTISYWFNLGLLSCRQPPTLILFPALFTVVWLKTLKTIREAKKVLNKSFTR